MVEGDGKEKYFTMNHLVGACYMIVRTDWCMKDSELEMRMCVMALGSSLPFRRWSIKEDGVMESDGEEVFSMTAMEMWCMMESG